MPTRLDQQTVILGTLGLSFRDVFVGELETAESQAPEIPNFVRALSSPDFGTAPARQDDLDPSISEELDQALTGLGCSTALAEAVKQIAPLIRLYHILEGAPVGPALERGLVAGQIGLSDQAPARLGLFLLSPDIHYPLHHHTALELYYVVSGVLGIQHGRDGTPFDVPAGAFSVTPPNRLHALTTSAEPCLLVYAWTGSISPYAFWWDRDTDGLWRRTHWDRGPTGLWSQLSCEPVTQQMLAEVGEL